MIHANRIRSAEYIAAMIQNHVGDVLRVSDAPRAGMRPVIKPTIRNQPIICGIKRKAVPPMKAPI